jgi:hypothetical protein
MIAKSFKQSTFYKRKCRGYFVFNYGGVTNFALVDFQLNSNLKLFVKFFKLTFLHISISGPFCMVFEHFWNSFDLEDSMNGFIQLH